MNARYEPTLFMPMTPTLLRLLEATISELIALREELDGNAPWDADNDNDSDSGSVER